MSTLKDCEKSLGKKDYNVFSSLNTPVKMDIIRHTPLITPRMALKGKDGTH